MMTVDTARRIPLIPAGFFIFFGDNWIHYWLERRGLYWILIDNCYIYHKNRHYRDNLNKKMNYAGILKRERKLYEQFARRLRKREF